MITSGESDAWSNNPVYVVGYDRCPERQRLEITVKAGAAHFEWREPHRFDEKTCLERPLTAGGLCPDGFIM